MDFLNAIYDKRDKPISESSKKLYNRNLKKLNNDNDVTNFDFLKNPRVVLDKIKHHKPTTQRSYIISICTVLKNEAKHKQFYDQYFDILTKMNNDLKVRTDKTEKQEKNWMSNDEINDIYKKLSLKIVKKIKTKEDFNNLLNYVVLSLYTLHKPRRNIDYTLMKISNDTSNDEFNYLDMNRQIFIFNNYKTKGKYDKVIVPIEDNLFDIIKLYLSNHPDKSKVKNKNYNVHFLVNSYNEPINKSNDMTRLLNKIFGKKIGSSMLRNMYLTNKYGDMIGELKKDTKQMSTSVDVALDTYIKST